MSGYFNINIKLLLWIEIPGLLGERVKYHKLKFSRAEGLSNQKQVFEGLIPEFECIKLLFVETHQQCEQLGLISLKSEAV